jgi:hypothetical protein
LKVIEQLKAAQAERRKLLTKLRASVDSLLNERQPGGPRGTQAQRRNGSAIRNKLLTVSIKVRESEKLLAQLEKACRR